jgi:hypothetical protein
MNGVFYRDFLTAVETAGERDFDTLVITPDVQFVGSRQVSEILTLFALKVDAEYYQGKTEGERPYEERFRYRNLTAADLTAAREGLCFVQKSAALPQALPPGWICESFGDYSLLYYGG